MNKNDRKQVAAIVSKLEELKSQMEELTSQLETLAEAEQEKYDNMSEGLQNSERGEALQESANVLAVAKDALENGNVHEALDELGNLEL